MTRPADEESRRRGDAAAAAAAAAADAALSTAVSLLVVVGISLAVQHRAAVTARARAVWRRAVRRPPGADELEVAAFAARVSAWSAGEGR